MSNWSSNVKTVTIHYGDATEMVINAKKLNREYGHIMQMSSEASAMDAWLEDISWVGTNVIDIQVDHFDGPIAKYG